MRNNLLPKKLRIKFFAYKYGLYAFIFLLIIAFAFLLGKHIEAVNTLNMAMNMITFLTGV